MREPPRLSALLEDAGRRLKLGPALATGKLWARWPSIVGPAIAEHVEPTSLRGGVLRVRADSPAWATEVGYLGSAITARANEALGGPIVGEVRVWTGPGAPLSSGPAGAEGKHRRRVMGRRSPDHRADLQDDPRTAFERARKAWAERRAKPR